MSNPFEKKVDPFLKKKWDRVFNTFFDLNKGGTIDWKDFEILFEKVKTLRGEKSREYTIVHDAMLMVWKGLLSATKGTPIHENVDYSLEISMDEWDKIWKKFNPHQPDIWQWEYLKFMFFLIDSSGDKYIDEAEYVEVMKLYDIAETASSRAFQKFAVDKNGKKLDKVSYGDFVRLWNEFFTSADQNAPGSHLFGNLT